MKANRTRLTLISLLLGALFLSGCGAKQTMRSSGSSDNSSRTVNGKRIACNQFSAPQEKLSGNIQVYIAPDGTEREDMLRMRIRGLSNKFDSNSNFKLRFVRVKANPDGSIYQDKTKPVEFRIELQGNPISGYMTEISIKDVNEIKSQHAVSASTAQEFFEKVDILLFDVDYTWDMLQIGLFENTTSTAYANVLMPPFSANPNDYASDHAEILWDLHPFWTSKDNTSLDFANLSLNWCF